MALVDLSRVTRALIRLVQEHVRSSGAWTGADPPPVSPMPPDKLNGGDLGIYLYHLTEDAHFKNQQPPGADVPPVRYTPMGLNLYYQLTANNASDDEAGFYQAQLFLGLAVKALHDYPSLTDATEVNGVTIFQEVGLADADNRIRLTLQPIPHNEAVSFWTAGSASLRLSAYYQASVVLLEPEEPDIRAGRVLRYGVHTFVAGAPRLDGSENTLTFSVPGVSAPQQLKLRPAEAPPTGPGPPLPESRVTFTGIDLAGDETHLLLRGARWTEPRQADAGWGVAATPNRVLATVRETIGGEAVLPGIHAASVRVVRRRTLPDGRVRRFEQTSNQTPFTITPRIEDPIDGPDDDNIVTVRGYIFQHQDLEPGDLQVYVGINRLEPDTDGVLGPAEFTVDDANTLRLCLPEGLTPGDHVPLRLLINGAESAPRWIEVPS